MGQESEEQLHSLGATIEEGHKTIREHPKNGCKDGEWSRGQNVQPRAEEAEGKPHGSLQLLTANAGAVLSSALWWQ